MTKRILVVDDEGGFSELLQCRLRNLDYEVLSANSGTEALNKARTERPDVILLGLLLPDLDGLTVCEILRRLPSTRSTPILLMTSLANEATRYAAKIAGASGLISKALDFDEFNAQLDIAFASKPAGDEILPKASPAPNSHLNDQQPTKGKHANHNPTRSFAQP